MILPQLENLVRRVQVQSSDFSDLDCHVYLQNTKQRTYVIEISKGRVSRSVIVDQMTIRHLESGIIDGNLSRELRVAMLAVTRLTQDRR